MRLDYIGKLLPVLPLYLLLYRGDIMNFAPLPTSIQYLLTSLILVAFCFASKIRVFVKAFQLSKVNYITGVLLFLFSALLYIYGSYSNFSTFFHFESSIFFLVSYFALRFGTAISKKILKATLFLTVSYGVTLLPLTSIMTLFFFTYSTIVFILVYFRFSRGYLVIPLSILFICLVSILHPNIELGFLKLKTEYLIPSPLLFLANASARKVVYSPVKVEKKCNQHLTDDLGFCLYCGRDVADAKFKHGFGLWGLITLVVAVMVLNSSVIYGLILSNKPYEAYFYSSGYATSQIPALPEGWQVNSSHSLSSPFDTYLSNLVLVPASNPELKNYTLYYALSRYYAYLPISQGEIPGWKRTSLNNTNMGGIEGYLASYSATNQTMLVYIGKTTLSFLSNGTLQRYNVAIGIERVFKNSLVSEDVAEFNKDFNILWTPWLKRDSYFSAWTDFIYSVGSGFAYLSTAIIASASSVLIFYYAYLVRMDELKVRDAIERALFLDDNSWDVISRIVTSREGEVTTLQLSGEPAKLMNCLRLLETEKLVRRAPSEYGSEPVGVWRLGH